MTLQIDLGIFVTVAALIVGAWWAIATIAIRQFEKRQEERFTGLADSIGVQKRELDSHMNKQDMAMNEIRRVENELVRCQLDAATKYQTKDDAGKQFGQLIQEIRGLGTRIDALHVRPNGQ